MKAILHQLNKYLAVAASVLISLTSVAREQSDTLRKDNNAVLRDARVYSMQRRFRNRDVEKFKSYHFWDNSFIGFSVGRDNSFRPEFADGTELSFQLGKWIGASHGIRLSVVAAEGKDNYDGGAVDRIGARLSYLFNFTHYLWGYNPYRYWDLSAVIGAGVAKQFYNENSDLSWSGHLGLNFSFRAIGNLSFFVEPMLNVAYDPGLYKHDVNWRQYVPTFNASAGLVYNFRNKDYKNPFPYKKVYVFAGAGPLFHNNFTNREDVSLFRGLGASANVGFGFYCKEWLGVRTSAQFSNCLWDGDRSHGMRSNTYMAFRLETVFDILPAINLKYTDSRFGVALMLGPETGYMRKLDGDLVINSWYTGATGAISFRYGVAKGLDICLEPRITVLPYSAPTDEPAPQKYWERNYYDGLFGVNLGVIYRFKNR